MAFTEFTCRSGGSNLYAGSLDGSAEASTTPLATFTNGAWNSAGGIFTPNLANPQAAGVAVGQWVSVYADGASAPTGFVARVTAVSTTTITLSTTAKSGTAPSTAASGRTAVVGGAWAGPSGASGFPFGFVQNTMTDASSNPPRVNFKNNATYSVTAAVTHSGSGPAFFQGYSSAAGDGGRATIDGGTSGAAYTPLSLTGSGLVLADFVLQNNGATGSANLLSVTGAGSLTARVAAIGSRGSGLRISNSAAVECEAYGNNLANSATLGGVQLADAAAIRCVSHDNTGSNNNGFYVTGAATLVGCVADSNGKYGVRLNSTGINLTLLGCALYGNGSSGVRLEGGFAYAESCAFASNAAYGVDVNSALGGFAQALKCAFYSNTSGQTNGPVDASGSVTLTGDPFTDAANGDFSLNNTAGAGAACRGAGRGAFLQTSGYSASTTGYPDIGAAQHQDSGGSSTTFFVPVE